MKKPEGRGKVQELSLDSAAGHLLEECRMVLPGIQALFGFQLIAVFSPGFDEKLGHIEQLLHLAAMMLSVLAMSLVMAPAALHRMAEPGQVSERFVWLASRLVLFGMLPLALGIALDAYVVARVVLEGSALGAVAALALVAVLFWLWVVLPLRHRARYR
jgi:Family of unknown function (DUF6328)